MSEEGDFVVCLLAKLRADGRAHGPDTCDYDEVTQTATLGYRRPDGSIRSVRLELPADGVRSYLDSLDEEADIRYVWGPGVDRVEAAARFASIHLDERVATSDDDPLVIRYRVAT